MNIHTKMNHKFKDLEGGLFSTVTKADVGEGAAKFLAAGGDNMAWADPFFPNPSIPDAVKNAMIEALEGGCVSHYVMPIGDGELRKALSEKISTQIGLDINPSRNVIVTPGSDSGLLYALMPFIEEGDEIMIPNPSYPSNALNAKLLGGKAISVPLYEEDGYQIRIEEFEKQLTSKTKMVLISHPNNPTTTVFRRKGLEELAAFIVKNDLILVTDQAFEDHIYDEIEFVSPCTLPGMWERTLTVCSISKGFGLSGFRIGYIYGDDHVMDVLYGGAVNVLGASNTLASIGAVAALKDRNFMKDNYNKLLKRRNLAYEILSTIPGVTMQPSESGILSWLNISKLGTSEEIVNYLMEYANIMVNQGTPYGSMGEGHIRIVTACFADDAEAAEKFHNIKNALTQLAKEKGIFL